MIDTFGNQVGEETMLMFPSYSCMTQPHCKILHKAQGYKLTMYEMLKEHTEFKN